MKKSISFFILFFFLLSYKAQDSNLIFNNSFESLQKVKQLKNSTIKNIPIAQGWFVPTKGTSDFYSKQNKNSFEKVKAQNGTNYVGLYIHEMNLRYREYVSSKLIKRLQKDTTYELAFYLRIPKGLKTEFTNIGFSFTSTPYNSTNYHPLPTNSSTYLSIDTLIKTKSKWILIKKQFKAKGNEQYITFGNFIPVEEIHLKPTSPGSIKQYYYLDNLSLIKINNVAFIKEKIQLDTIFTNTEKETPIKLDLILDGVLFNYDSDELTSDAKIKMDSIAETIKTSNSKQIFIYGFSSSEGKDDYNLELSERRALSGLNYLKSLLPFVVFQHIGFGEKHPVCIEHTEVCNEKNRRLEITSYQKY